MTSGATCLTDSLWRLRNGLTCPVPSPLLICPRPTHRLYRLTPDGISGRAVARRPALGVALRSRRVRRSRSMWRRIRHRALLCRPPRLPGRHHLARALAADHLPPLQELASWIRALTWVIRWELGRTALCRLALEAGADPAAYYRTVKRLTGTGWSEVRHRGIAWLLERLVDRCQVGGAHRGTSAEDEQLMGITA